VTGSGDALGEGVGLAGEVGTTTGRVLTAAPTLSTSAVEVVMATAQTTAMLAATVVMPPIASHVRLSTRSSHRRTPCAPSPSWQTRAAE
jgi:hypothetical protein